MNRRSFLFSAGATLGGAVLASRFGRWFRQGSGLLVPSGMAGHLQVEISPEIIEMVSSERGAYLTTAQQILNRLQRHANREYGRLFDAHFTRCEAGTI